MKAERSSVLELAHYSACSGEGTGAPDPNSAVLPSLFYILLVAKLRLFKLLIQNAMSLHVQPSVGGSTPEAKMKQKAALRSLLYKLLLLLSSGRLS